MMSQHLTDSVGVVRANVEADVPPRTLKQRLRSLAPYAYISPFYIIFFIFGAFPILFTFWIALHDWNPLGEPEFTGTKNFVNLMTDPRFWNATKNTFSIWFISTIPQLLLALGLATLLNHQLLKLKTGFRMIVLSPQITSVLAVGIIFSQLFGRDFGLINTALVEPFGFERIDFQVGTLSSHIAVSTMVMWRWVGYNSLIYLAAMQAIPKSLYECAAIDGANKFRQLVHVTIPQLRSTIIFTVIVSTIGGMQIFAEPLVFSGIGGAQGGNKRQFQTLTMFLYEQGFERFKFGYASAIAWALFLMIVLFALLNYFVTQRISQDEN